MSETLGTDTRRLSVSIVAGPAADALLARREALPGTIIEQPSGANPDQIIERIRSLATQPGVENLIIVETADAILIADRHSADSIKKLVDRLPPELL